MQRWADAVDVPRFSHLITHLAACNTFYKWKCIGKSKFTTSSQRRAHTSKTESKITSTRSKKITRKSLKRISVEFDSNMFLPLSNILMYVHCMYSVFRIHFLLLFVVNVATRKWKYAKWKFNWKWTGIWWKFVIFGVILYSHHFHISIYGTAQQKWRFGYIQQKKKKTRASCTLVQISVN